ncbi:HAD-like domain-containing protein [Scheffersomyces xylosifermentans]|uniref:HAD-like domain-containing protein n=1 Tax=Scheffersomyces xylosifermentans TaxID=1304137 RepID=UPI00315CAA48
MISGVPLTSHPFNLDNLQKIRETSDEFPKPSLLSFDVFGTLYTPKEPVPVQYHKIASQEFGINKSVEDITKEFPKIYAALQREYPNYGKGTVEIASSDEWWSELIVRLFGIEHYKDNEISAQLCTRLLDHFVGDEAYSVYDDVVPTLTTLKEHGIKMAVSSNSDGRVRQILNNLGLSQFFENENIYLSYDVGASKPQRSFYDSVACGFYEREFRRRLPLKLKGKFLENCWHVGDDYKKDFIGPIQAGWNGIFIDRDHSSEFFRQRRLPEKESYPGCSVSQPVQHKHNEKEMLLLANNRIVITGLGQLLEIFKLEE